jgi:serine/threonine protein kinase
VSQPATIGSYKIVRTLGAGLMGPVYLGTNANQYWALRVLDPNLIRATSHVNRLVGDVLHPAVVRYKEVGADPSLGGFVSTDFVDSRAISRDGLSGLRSAVRVTCLAKLAEGIKAMHGRGIVHGNIKRSNVLLRRKDAKVDGLFIDAGFVYAASQATIARLTAQAFPAMAPELVAAYASLDRNAVEKVLSPAVDIYALGVLVAEVLSGRSLFTQAREAGDLIRLKQSTVVQVTGINAPLESMDMAAVNRVVAAATSPDPAKRPTSVQALIDTLVAACQAKAAA